MGIFKLIKTQLFHYLIIGTGSVFIDYLGYISLLSFSLDSSLSKRISFVLGALFSFLLNKKITFKSKANGFREPITFSILYILSFFGNSIIHDAIEKMTSNQIAFLLATIFSIIFNFLGQKFIVFKAK